MKYRVVKHYAFYLVVGFFTLCWGCANQINIKHTATKILGHRGSGANAISVFKENTLPSVKNAFEMLDGAEVDVQCSKDGTIWLYHDAGLPENGLHLLCVAMSYDEELINLTNQDTSLILTKLEEVFVLMSQMEKTPYLSLDVKGHFPNGCFENSNALLKYFELMAQNLIQLLEKYTLHQHVIVETNYQYFLDLMLAQNPRIECFYLGYNNFSKCLGTAIEKSYQGISFNFRDSDFKKEDIDKAHKKGLKVMLWTINKKEDFDKIISWNPDYIQTGNIEYGKEFLEKQSKSLVVNSTSAHLQSQ
jgi:glycerophosphoryl diester phosphodiesterase